MCVQLDIRMIMSWFFHTINLTFRVCLVVILKSIFYFKKYYYMKLKFEALEAGSNGKERMSVSVVLGSLLK